MFHIRKLKNLANAEFDYSLHCQLKWNLNFLYVHPDILPFLNYSVSHIMYVRNIYIYIYIDKFKYVHKGSKLSNSHLPAQQSTAF